MLAVVKVDLAFGMVELEVKAVLNAVVSQARTQTKSKVTLKNAKVSTPAFHLRYLVLHTQSTRKL